MKLLVTGGAGFIGSNFVRHALTRWPSCTVTILDKLTYAGNRASLKDVEATGRTQFVHGDICDVDLVMNLTPGHDAILNFAAESHVDRSIQGAADFVRTDIEGTRCLLDAARINGIGRYLQVSTDEVYGDLPSPQRARPDSPLRPRSPYSASKASGDLMVQAYHVTYGLDTVITRGSNTYGPYQYPEKLISLFVTNAIDGRELPVYGDGMQVRDWIYVEDHCRAISTALEKGTAGAVYHAGTEAEHPNIEIIKEIVRLTGASDSIIRYVADRPGHDRRYALDASGTRDLGWECAIGLQTGLAQTVNWYQSREDWWRPLNTAEFQEYYSQQYQQRLEASGALPASARVDTRR